MDSYRQGQLAQATRTIKTDDDIPDLLVIEDFNDGKGAELLPRFSLIELILPFAEDSKSILNSEGLLPWQLAQSDKIIELLKPGGH